MKGLILFGSPNKKGQTQGLLNQCINYSSKHIKWEQIDVGDRSIKHCIGCNVCNKSPFTCVFNDDMVEIYDAIESSDVVVLATPIYFNSMTSILKSLVDRCQRFYNMKVNHGFNFKKKKVFIVATAGSKHPKSFDALKNVGDYFFLSINGHLVDELYISNTDEIDCHGTTFDLALDFKNTLCNLHKDG